MRLASQSVLRFRWWGADWLFQRSALVKWRGLSQSLSSLIKTPTCSVLDCVGLQSVPQAALLLVKQHKTHAMSWQVRPENQCQNMSGLLSERHASQTKQNKQTILAEHGKSVLSFFPPGDIWNIQLQFVNVLQCFSWSQLNCKCPISIAVGDLTGTSRWIRNSNTEWFSFQRTYIGIKHAD